MGQIKNIKLHIVTDIKNFPANKRTQCRSKPVDKEELDIASVSLTLESKSSRHGLVIEATRYVGEEEEVDVSHCGDDEGNKMFLRIGNQVSGNAHGEDTEEFSKSHA